MNQLIDVRCPNCGRKATAESYLSTKDGETKTVTMVKCPSRLRPFATVGDVRQARKKANACPVAYL